MNALLPPLATFLAAIVAAIVAMRVLKSNIEANRLLQKERLEGEMALAERRFKYERDLIHLKRGREVAEKALSLVYQARDSIRGARSHGIRGGEGASRPRLPDEEREIGEARDTYFVPIERLQRDTEIFSGMHSLKYEVSALFGNDATGPINALLDARWQVLSAAQMLIQTALLEGPSQVTESMLPIRQTAFAAGQQPDKIETQMAAALENMEDFCRPILQSGV